MSTVVILGATGMLGNMVHRHFREHTRHAVIAAARQPIAGMVPFDAHAGCDASSMHWQDVDYVINCIGITKPYCHDDRLNEVQNAIAINAQFPHALAAHAEVHGYRVIQIATDCVYSGRSGGYMEDAIHDPMDMYGKTKCVGEVMASPRFLNVRCSIIGPEAHHRAFLLEWFLAQPEGATVNGFSHHRWNGITTLQFAQLCDAIISGGHFDALVQQSRVHHFVPNETVTKYELLTIFRDVFEKRVDVREVHGTDVVDRTLATKYDALARLIAPSTIRSALGDIQALRTDTRVMG